jgi:hypothetical protein
MRSCRPGRYTQHRRASIAPGALAATTPMMSPKLVVRAATMGLFQGRLLTILYPAAAEIATKNYAMASCNRGDLAFRQCGDASELCSPKTEGAPD